MTIAPRFMWRPTVSLADSSGPKSGWRAALIGVGTATMMKSACASSAGSAVGRRCRACISSAVVTSPVASTCWLRFWILSQHVDATGEVTTAELMQARHLRPTADPAELAQADFIIVAVPTPINAARQPDFGPLESASETVGRHMKPGATVIYESTVYPGATEEVCVPILEKFSGMR